MRLTKIVGGAFAASIRLLVQPGRVSSKYFGERHSCLSHLQADLAAACRRDTNLEMGGGQQPCKFAVSLLKHVTVPREFSWVFWHFSGTARPSLVKLPIKESVVKVNYSLHSWYYLIRFAQHGLLKVESSFIKLMCLTCYG